MADTPADGGHPDKGCPPGATGPTDAPGLTGVHAEAQERAQRLFNETHAMLLGLVEMFGPLVSQKSLAEMAAAITQEQLEIQDKIWPSLTNRFETAERPGMVVRVTGPNGKTGDLTAPKTLTLANGDPGQGLLNVLMLSFLMTPPVRALFRLHGYSYVFLQAKPPDAASRIKLVR